MKFLASVPYSAFYGFTLPIRAAALILRQPKLLLISLAPIVITLALSIYGIAQLKASLVAMGTHWLAGLGFAPGSLGTQAAILFFQLVLFVIAAISFSFLAGIIASPFNDWLSETAETRLAPAGTPAVVGPPWLKVLLKDLVRTVLITGLQLFLVTLSILTLFLPGLNLIFLALTFWLMSFQFLSYPQARRAEGMRESFRFLARFPVTTVVFGGVLGTLFALPIISCLALPLAVVGGTILYRRGRGLPYGGAPTSIPLC